MWKYFIISRNIPIFLQYLWNILIALEVNMNNLRKLRHQKRLTLLELAKETTISKSALSYLENEQRSFTQEQLEILSKYFNVSTDYLLGISDNPNSIIIKVADADGTITPIQHELINATKGLTADDLIKINEYIEFLKSKKGNNQ